MSRGEWLGVWFKMYNNIDDVDHNGKHKFWTGAVDNEELGAWIRLLCLASKGNPKGAIQIQGVSLLPHQIDTAIRTDKKYVEKWLKQGALKQENDTVYIENWKLWQSEQDRKNSYVLKRPPKSPTYKAPIKSPLTSIELNSTINKRTKDTIVPEIPRGQIDYSYYVNLWNQTPFPKVTKITESRKAKIRTRIQDKDFDLSKIIFNLINCKNDFMFKYYTFDWIFGNDVNWVKVMEGNYMTYKKKETTEDTSIFNTDARTVYGKKVSDQDFTALKSIYKKDGETKLKEVMERIK